MATYAAYVWSALAVFLIGLAWDYFSPLWTLRKLLADAQRKDARNRARKVSK